MSKDLSREGLSTWVVPSHQGPLASPNPVGWKATSDAEALAVWLTEHGKKSPHTEAAYRREIERFLFWLADQGMVVSDAMREDYHLYARFLMNPTPASKWISPRRYRRDDPRWKPFIAPLSANSAHQSLTILNGAISFLQETGWLRANPMPPPKRLVVTRKVDRQEMVESRQIPESLYEELQVYIHESMDLGDSQRARFRKARYEVALALAGILGARSADMTKGFLSDFGVRNVRGKAIWVWHIPEGKGRRQATLPVPKQVMNKIAHLRLTLGMNRYPEPGEAPCPIMASAQSIPRDEYPDVGRLKAMHRSSFYKMMRALFGAFAVHLQTQRRQTDALLIDQVSTHWLRHTALKRAVKQSGNLLLAKKMGRHKNVNTTAIYAESTLEELDDWFEKQDW